MGSNEIQQGKEMRNLKPVGKFRRASSVPASPTSLPHLLAAAQTLCSAMWSIVEGVVLVSLLIRLVATKPAQLID